MKPWWCDCDSGEGFDGEHAESCSGNQPAFPRLEHAMNEDVGRIGWAPDYGKGSPRIPRIPGKVEAAGIEPASGSSPNGSNSREKIARSAPGRGQADCAPLSVATTEQGRLDRSSVVPDGLRELDSCANDPAKRASDFSYRTTICGIDFEVVREGKHLNLHLYEEGQVWRFEEITPNLIERILALKEAVLLAYVREA